MEIKIVRQYKNNKATVGTLTVDNIEVCNTLEDVDRGLKQTDTLDSIQKIKVQDQTAIPTGRYQVIIDMSTRFKKLMPHILDVPGFAGIRIHSGNTDADTDGCILLGTRDKSNPDFVSNSRDAFAKFYPKLQQGLKEGSVYINII